MAINLRSLGNFVRTSARIVTKLRSAVAGNSDRPVARAAPGPAGGSPHARGGTAELSSAYPGDFQGVSTVRYAPAPDGSPDPGEVVWTWVPFEEDHTRGKDRPVLLIGGNGSYLLGLMLTSKDHDQDRRGGNDYVDVGTGTWDRLGRPSEVKLDRILQICPADIRREGAVLDCSRFELVAAGLRRRHAWS
ncbi:type II toxin-antitoxin system PemK/MazF family toxin [Pseudarthrobacter sp. N5]|uniref:type II toxin-antitoxin system PemK/MazF family toxin n=1 Tax=Pseudarthrobacter sp. N5 TaxID=3418416 RepID=UPI003CF41B60